MRRLMTSEANAAIEGAVEAGATRILVNDSHWLMRNLLAEELHPSAELLSGGPKLRSMVEGVELGFDAALFVGYHAMAGTRHAIIDHTYTGTVHEVRLNGRGLNYGVVITLAFLAACVYLIASGHGVEGTTLGVIFIIGLLVVTGVLKAIF